MRSMTARSLLLAARADDAFLVADDERRLLDLNEAACRLLGAPAGELVGRRMDDFLTPRARSSFHRRWGTLLAIYQMRTADGLPRDVALTAVANCPMEGTHLGRLRPTRRARA
jgi:PAS domain S-box-containing protein